MKKKKIAQKLSLDKKTIASLSKKAGMHIVGGADTESDCPFQTRFQDCLTDYATRCGSCLPGQATINS